MENESTNQETEVIIYNADASQRYPFGITENGETYESAHIFKPVDDDKHYEFVNFLCASDDDDGDEALNAEAVVNFWREQVSDIENVETEEGQDFRDIADVKKEIIPLTTMLLAVVVKAKPATGKRKINAPITQTVTTEAYFNGEVCEQSHILKAKNDEFQKKYTRIQKSQFKIENTKGLRREPKVEIVLNHTDKAALYDEMFISSSGFKSWTPRRFKVAVLDDIFAGTIDPKKS